MASVPAISNTQHVSEPAARMRGLSNKRHRPAIPGSARVRAPEHCNHGWGPVSQEKARRQETHEREKLLPFSRSVMTKLVVVDVAIGRRRWWHGQRGGYVEGVAGNRTSVRVATDFRVGEQ